jgi:hypothetical protein
MFRSNLDKKAWLRIVEAFIGILMITGVVLTMMSRPGVSDASVQQETVKLEKFILDRVVADPGLRSQILVEDVSGVNKVLAGSVPAGISYYARVCNYDEICALGMPIPYDVYSEEALVSSNLTYYDSAHVKVIKLFFWHGPWPEGTCPSFCTEGVTQKSCFGDNLITKDCVKNSSNCFIENITSNVPCGTGKVCVNGECTTPEVIFSDLRLSLAMVISPYKIATRYYYNHTRTFTEYNGVGVNLTSYKSCLLDGTCNVPSPVDYKIGPFGTVTANRLADTNIVPEKITYIYFGKDNSGKNVEINASLCLNGLSVTPNC